MAIRDMQGKAEDLIPVKNVIVSVFDKTKLELLVSGLVRVNPGIRFLSTGGTYNRVKEILGNSFGANLTEVAEFTGSPEMEGGLVKTLHPTIYGGILGERNNPEHQKFLGGIGGAYIDLVVVNLYPFRQVINSPDATFETARGHIDIGGPAMIRAAAKNFPSCAVVCDPEDYEPILEHIRDNNGQTSLSQRLRLANKAFATTAAYEADIANYMRMRTRTRPDEIIESYLGGE